MLIDFHVFRQLSYQLVHSTSMLRLLHLLRGRSNAYSFQNLDAIAPDGLGKVIAVPSRLYYTVSAKQPLAGMRIAIKDNFRLQGLKSANGCRSFLSTYEADRETADYVKLLIDLGAVIVGKTKMTAFASSEKPCDWWDFQCPFNPRGDEHLTPGGSSTGSATATAACSWLDICLGSDSKLLYPCI